MTSTTNRCERTRHGGLRLAVGVLAAAAATAALAAPWARMSPADGPLVTAAPSPQRDGQYFLGGVGATIDGAAVQVWETGDGGKKWRRAAPIDLDPSSRAWGSVVSGGGVLYVETAGRLLRSDDDGTTWAPLDLGGTPGEPARLLSVNPANGNDLVVLRGDTPLRSSNGGASWATLAGGPATTGTVDWFARVYYLVSTAPAQTRSYLLDSGGLLGTANFAPQRIAVDRGFGLAFTPVGAYRSINNGVTWLATLVDEGQVDLGGVAYAPGDASFAYVWERDGARAWRTTNRGGIWTPIAQAPCRCDWTGIAVSALDANVLAASTTAGAWLSNDAGQTWTAVLGSQGMPGAAVRQVLSDKGDRVRKWLVTDVRRLRPLTSDDLGETWTEVVEAPNGDIARPAFVHPDVPGLIFGPGTPHAGGTTLWRSVDSGDTWKSVLVFGGGGDEALVDFVAGPAPGDLIAVVRLGSDAGGTAAVFRSTNQGGDWVPRNAPGPIDPQAAARTTAGLLLAGRPAVKSSHETLWRSTDEAVTWQPIALAPDRVIGVTALRRAPSLASRVYAGTDAGGADALWRSDDGGLTWTRVARAVGDAPVTSIAVHPTQPDHVVIAQGVDGVFRSTDGGATWASLDAGLLERDIQGVAFDQSETRYLYASGSTGAYRADLQLEPPASVTRAVEFYYPAFGHYFITASAAEIDVLDRGVIAGWQRTGFDAPAEELGALPRLPVCRFFSIGFVPRSSHFYTPYAQECDQLKTSPLWTYEGIAFAWRLPDGAGRCQSGQRQLYRLYNNAQGGAPNHRYTTSLRVVDQMVAAGSVAEGAGAGGSFGCVPL